jgi:hypothetical protein
MTAGEGQDAGGKGGGWRRGTRYMREWGRVDKRGKTRNGEGKGGPEYRGKTQEEEEG